MKQHTPTARFIGLVLTLLAVFISLTSQAIAAVQTYEYTWSTNALNPFKSGSVVTMQRAGRVRQLDGNLNPVATQYTDWVCLGPAQWKVYGVIDNGPYPAPITSVEEVWTAGDTSWQDVGTWNSNSYSSAVDRTRFPVDAGIAYEYTNTAYTNCQGWGAEGFEPNGGQSTIGWNVRPMGSYGAAVVNAKTWDNSYPNLVQAMKSQPVSWSIQGCIDNTDYHAGIRPVPSPCEQHWQDINH